MTPVPGGKTPANKVARVLHVKDVFPGMICFDRSQTPFIHGSSVVGA
jgi:hypothetical protein